MIEILTHDARSGNVDAKVIAASPEQTGDALEHEIGACLIVHRVEGSYEVESTLPGEFCSIALLKHGVCEPPSLCLCASGGDALGRKVVANEKTLREGVRHNVYGMT